jgi:hypothetical protein
MMAIDIDKCFQKGTKEYDAFWSELKLKADLLEKIRDANVPVLWRPFTDPNCNQFWWGKQGPETFKKLWITMFDYFVYKRNLNNLIWVLCYAGEPDEFWFPGKKYVDVAGADNYNGGDDPQADRYHFVKSIVNDNFPIVYHICGVPPDPDKCLSQGAVWSWWMEWHTDFLKKVDTTYLKHIYNHDLIITLDEVPDIVKTYGLNNN